MQNNVTINAIQAQLSQIQRLIFDINQTEKQHVYTLIIECQTMFD
jgi:hypothetical protein